SSFLCASNRVLVMDGMSEAETTLSLIARNNRGTKTGLDTRDVMTVDRTCGVNPLHTSRLTRISPPAGLPCVDNALIAAFWTSGSRSGLREACKMGKLLGSWV